jgi:hypothetical protein
MYLLACDVPWTVTTTISCPGVSSLVDTSAIIPSFALTDIDLVLAGQLFASAFTFVGVLHVSAFALGFLVNLLKGDFNERK